MVGRQDSLVQTWTRLCQASNGLVLASGRPAELASTYCSTTQYDLIFSKTILNILVDRDQLIIHPSRFVRNQTTKLNSSDLVLVQNLRCASKGRLANTFETKPQQQRTVIICSLILCIRLTSPPPAVSQHTAVQADASAHIYREDLPCQEWGSETTLLPSIWIPDHVLLHKCQADFSTRDVCVCDRPTEISERSGNSKQGQTCSLVCSDSRDGVLQAGLQQVRAPPRHGPQVRPPDSALTAPSSAGSTPASGRSRAS